MSSSLLLSLRKIFSRKSIVATFLCIVSLWAAAQNVGIGTPIPSENLHVDSTIKIGKNNTLGSIGRKNLIKFGDGNYVTIGEEQTDDKLYMRFGDLILLKSASSVGNGRIGVNTEAPTANLDVNGSFRLRSSGAETGKVLRTDATGLATWQNDSFALPYNAFSVASDTLFKIVATGTNAPVAHFENSNSGNSRNVLSAYTNGNGNALLASNSGEGSAALFTSSSSDPVVRIFTTDILNQGNGIECTLAFNGTSVLHPSPPNFLKLSTSNGIFPPTYTTRARIDATGKGFFNGGTQNSGADVAEAFAVEGLKQAYEPGDVLIISPFTDRMLAKSQTAYSTTVAGVYATKPGVLLTEKLSDENMDDLVPLGIIGVIPTKVCNEGGPICRGDLLVSSSRPGHAMKADGQKTGIGMVIGKALENFDASSGGLIKVLVTVR